MSWNSPLTRWQNEHPYQLEVENRAAEVAPKTEKRSYSLADPNFWRYFNLGALNLAKVDVNVNTVLGVPPFFSAVRYISEGVAMLDRKVKHTRADGTHETNEHPVAELINYRPHAHYTWFDFICALLTNACLGNGYARIHWDYQTMRPLYLEHIPFIYCRPEFGFDGTLWYRISGYLNGRTVSELVPHTDMIHVKGLSLDGVLGYDISMLHQSTFAVGIARGQYAESKLGNSVFPSIVVKTKESLEADIVATREQNLIERVGTSAKAGTPLYLDAEQDLQYIPPPALDAALEQLAGLNVEDVCRITKVPRDLLALDTHGTYGAGVQRSQDFLTHCLGPWIEKIQEEVNCKLFYYSESRKRRYYFEFDTSMYLALDKKAEAEVLVALVAGSVLTPNEARARLQMSPMEGANELFANINSLPLKDLVKVATAKYLSAEGEKLEGQQQSDNTQSSTENEPNTES